MPQTSADSRSFDFRAGRALLLGVLAMGAVAWIVSVPAVLLAVAAAATAAILTSQAARFSTLVIATLVSAAVGAGLGSLFFGQGPPLVRVLATLVATFAAGPWAVVAGFVVRTRALRRG